MNTGQKQNAASSQEAQSLASPTPTADAVAAKISTMTLAEKVGQLFVIVPDDLTGSTVTAMDDTLKQAIAAYQPGGMIFFADNLTDPEQTEALLKDISEAYQDADAVVPFLSVDEEGGSVARIASNPAFQAAAFPDMKEIGASGDVSQAADVGETIGAYLQALGFNMDFAPVADVLTNPANTVVADRSFGSDPALVTEMCQAVSDGLMDNGIISVWKHYPGHGSTTADSHTSRAYTDRTLEELLNTELVPYEEGDPPLIMAGHISDPTVTGDDTPASLSQTFIQDILRTRLGYDGAVITDSLRMGAITDYYSSGDAAVAAINAGVDLLLMPSDFTAAYQAIMDAVQNGTISEERIDESLTRILRLKQNIAP